MLTYIGYPRMAHMARSLSEHVRIGVQTDHLVKVWSELDRQDTRAASDVETPAGAVEVALLGQRLGQSQ